jgi:hypothetical protein
VVPGHHGIERLVVRIDRQDLDALPGRDAQVEEEEPADLKAMVEAS